MFLFLNYQHHTNGSLDLPYSCLWVHGGLGLCNNLSLSPASADRFKNSIQSFTASLRYESGNWYPPPCVSVLTVTAFSWRTCTVFEATDNMTSRRSASRARSSSDVGAAGIALAGRIARNLGMHVIGPSSSLILPSLLGFIFFGFFLFFFCWYYDDASNCSKAFI